MSTKGKRTVHVGRADGAESHPIIIEDVATTAIKPGAFLAWSGSGVAASPVAATVFGQMPLIADASRIEQNDIDTDYAISDRVYAFQPQRGELYNVRMATGQVLIRGSALSRAGTTGRLKLALTNGTEEIVAYSDEALTTAANDQLVRVRFI